MRLAFGLKYRGDETPSDFASRLSIRNWRDDLRRFCLDFGLKAQGLIDGDAEAIAALAELAGADAAALEREAFVRQAGTRAYVFRGERLQRSVLTRDRVRMCPACMEEDMDRLDVRPSARPYRRSQWLIGPIRTCARHGMGLIEIGTAPSPTKTHDTSWIIAEALPGLPSLVEDAPRRKESSFERYVAGRLFGGTGSPWLDRLPLYAAMHLCFVLGSVARHGPKVTLDGLDEADVWRCEAEGFDVANDGPAGIRKFLDGLQAPFRVRRSRAGPKAMYGRLYDWLSHECRDSAYDPVREVVREHAIDTLPFGPGDVLFGRKVTERRVHSVHTAARDLNVHPKRLRKALRNVGIVGDGTAGLSDHRVLAPPEAVAALAEGLKDTLRMTEARKYLNVPRPHDMGLLDAGFISPMVARARSPRGIQNTFRRVELDEFLQRLLARADEALAGDPHMETLLKAAKRCCCTVMEVVRLVLDGRLDRVGRDPRQRGFMSLLVDAREVRPLVVGPSYDGLSLREVEQEMRSNTTTVKSLVQNGFLEHRIVKNPVTGWMQPIVSTEAIARFRREYVTLSGLARERGEHFSRVKKALVAAGVEPVGDPEKLGVTLYSRNALDAETQFDA